MNYTIGFNVLDINRNIKYSVKKLVVLIHHKENSNFPISNQAAHLKKKVIRLIRLSQLSSQGSGDGVGGGGNVR